MFTSSRHWRRQMLAFGLLGAVLTLIVAGSAIFALSQTVETGRELSVLSRAQRFHQDADMMHDALRGDVSDALVAGRSHREDAKARVLRLAESHAKELRADLDKLSALRLPPDVAPGLSALRVSREAYLTLALDRVRAGLRGQNDAAARASFQRTFTGLVARQATMTATLAAAAEQVEATQTQHERALAGVLLAASGVALVGWAFLVGLLRRAGMRLFDALAGEAEQRAVAEHLQRTLLPERLPEVPGLRFAARSRPLNTAMRVGGDWYDVISLPSGDVGLVVGDVVGHDLRAATAMGQLRAALRAFAVYEKSPAAVLGQVNTVADLLNVTDLTTCLYAVVTPSTRAVRWSSAGHLNPLALGAAGHGQVLPGDPGPPIGVSTTAEYVDRTWQLERGGSLMLYTDGLVERRSTSITDNIRRLEHLGGPHADPEGLCDHVLEVMVDDEADVADDVTVLALQSA